MKKTRKIMRKGVVRWMPIDDLLRRNVARGVFLHFTIERRGTAHNNARFYVEKVSILWLRVKPPEGIGKMMHRFLQFHLGWGSFRGKGHQ